MQKRYIIRDKCTLLYALLIFSIGTYSLFGNTRGVNFFDLAAYQHRIKGVVTDSDGTPVQGASVRLKDTSTGTFTNNEGVFYLEATPTDVLVLSYIGFKKLEVIVGSSEELSLVLEEDVTDLGAVTVNAGYYSVKERERTGNIAKVTSEDIELQPIVSPIEALQGRMAGVEISQQDGMPGSAPVIRIRGTNSLRKEGNYPLYIIDGMPINSTPIESGMGFPENVLPGNIDPLSTLNLSNIESIEVLKDADATAIYGSRGANGVVLITTRKGQGYEQKTQIEARWYSGFSQVGRKMNLLNTEQYVKLREVAIANADLEVDANRAPDIALWDTNRYTDWQEELLGGMAPLMNMNLSVSGGNANTAFRLNGSFSKQGNVFPVSLDYKKATAGLTVNHRSTNEKFKIDLVLNYGTDQSESYSVNKIVESAYLLPPNAPPLYNEDGSLHWEEWSLLNKDNPLAGKYTTVNGEIHNLISNLMLSYEILPGLSIKSSFGYTRNTRESLGKSLNYRVPPAERQNTEHEIRKGFQKRLTWNIEPQITYRRSLGKGTIDALAGTTFQKNESDGLGIRGEGFVSESLIKDVNSANTYYNLGGRFNEYKYHALFGRLGYNWNHKYFINLTGRRDGSSRFGPDKRFSNFWAAGLAWIFTEEPFINNNIPFLSFGKLRGSYGTTGNDQIGDYQYLDSYESTSAPGGLYPTGLFNANFAWEENKKLEGAFQLGFLNDRINLGVSWYRNRSSNQLVGYPLPAMTGFTTVQANLPATVENTGWEIEMSTINIQSKNFRWQTSFNISYPKNELISFPGIEQTSYARIYKVGHPLDIVFRYQYDGIDSQTGFHKVRDVNEDGNYDFEDRVVIKNAGRQYYGGINNSFSFKGFQCSFLLDFIKQKSIKSTMFSTSAPGYSGGYYNRAIEDYTAWEDGTLYIEDSTAFYSSYLRAQSSDYGWVDSSFLRLKTLSLSYDIPSYLMEGIGIDTFRIFVSAQNVFTISSYAGLNLEANPSSLTIPPLRTITSGIQIIF
ncbi:SusC/RagA family TonB-linked outer membrane protein [Galbibacter sp. BG1]